MTPLDTTKNKLFTLHQGPFTGEELNDGFTTSEDEETALQEEADSFWIDE